LGAFVPNGKGNVMSGVVVDSSGHAVSQPMATVGEVVGGLLR